MNNGSRLALMSILAVTLVTFADGCTKSESQSSGNSGSNGGDTVSADKAAWLLASAPQGDVMSVAQAKADATEGQTIMVLGRIGGRMEPLSSDSAVFVIVDMEILHCGQMGEKDHCPTPWDYCCEPPDNLAANSATVQLVNAEAGDALEDVDPIAAGLEPLDEVIIVGTVGPRPSPEVLTIQATGVHRKSG